MPEFGELLGTVDVARAFTTTHEGAVYLHGGRSFEVTELDLDQRRVLVAPFAGDWYTQPKRETDTYIERLLDRLEGEEAGESLMARLKAREAERRDAPGTCREYGSGDRIHSDSSRT